MSVIDLISMDAAKFELESNTKGEALDELIELLAKVDVIQDKSEFKKAVLKREELSSTGIGMGIAIPHGKGAMVKEAFIAFGKSSRGIDFDSIDNKPVYLIFLIAVPEGKADIHLKSISEISRKLMHKEIREKIMKTQSFEELCKIFE